MKNRDRINEMNLYDFLLRIANQSDACIIKLASGVMPSVQRCNKYKTCAACLQNWLNEEEKTEWKSLMKKHTDRV